MITQLAAANIIPYGISNDDLLSKFCEPLAYPCSQVFYTLGTLTIVLAVVGLLHSAYKVQMGGDLSGIGAQLVLTLLVAVTMKFIPVWYLNSIVTLGPVLLANMGIDAKGAMMDFTNELANDTLDLIPGMIAATALGFFGIGIIIGVFVLVSVVLLVIAWAICGITWGVVILAYLLQIASMYVGLAIAPIFLGMLLFEKTRDTGTKYFMGLFGISFWQLGWGMGFVVIRASMSMIHNFLFKSSEAAGLQVANAFMGGIISSGFALLEAGFVYAIITKAPKIISAAITTGSQIGTGLISSGVGGAVGTAAGVAQAGAQVGMMAASGGASAPSMAMKSPSPPSTS